MRAGGRIGGQRVAEEVRFAGKVVAEVVEGEGGVKEEEGGAALSGAASNGNGDLLRSALLLLRLLCLFSPLR